MEEGECREDEGLNHREDLRDNERPVPVPAIDEYPSERTEEERRDLPHEADCAEQHGRACQPVHQPTRGDASHPCADQRNALPAEEQAEIARPQRTHSIGQLLHPYTMPLVITMKPLCCEE